jgi:CheY-like chemotaxis protein
MPDSVKKVTYLLVEDDETQSCILAKWLKKVAMPHEIDVLIENNLEDALATSNSRQPNCTFLDLLIPKKKGEPIAEADWRTAADCIQKFVPPVVVVTGMPDPDHSIEMYCYAKGAQNVFQKPYDTSFFNLMKDQTKLFAAHLLQAAGSAEMRSKLGPKGNGP